MNFEEAYKKVQKGTASEEEIDFVAAELDKIRRMGSILDELPAEPVISEAEEETVLKARKQFNHKTTIKILVISLICLLAVAAVTCGILFIPSTISAKRNQRIGEDEAVEIAMNKLGEYASDVSAFQVRDVDKRLNLHNGLGDAVYVYEIELLDGEKFIEYEFRVNTKTGYAYLSEMEYD